MTVTRRLAAILAADCDEISETGLLVAGVGRTRMGRACPLCPGISDINLFCYRKRIVYLDPEVSHGAFDLRVAKQELDST